MCEDTVIIHNVPYLTSFVSHLVSPCIFFKTKPQQNQKKPKPKNACSKWHFNYYIFVFTSRRTPTAESKSFFDATTAAMRSRPQVGYDKFGCGLQILFPMPPCPALA